ncbi:hydrogenase expression/formation protein HypE [Methylomarinum sp. Ch1-1]|uniref:Hydrogenase expression/formation protein HypE n=1 Tax=Methylomarinum roseum TaxID=3067653 RepID=A0AAU7NUD1_9GAMM|nr:hydrogenase expression/formation protein HypE [Methylomarinum sp. Ch1-1]MDP4519289.1 hydrogenase expression/formation protein HypE [Methylomarinum sp. Ch1-1]
MTEPKLNCPLPLNYEQIVMAHGGGGRMMQQLLDKIIRPAFDNDILAQQHDSAIINIPANRLAFTTDSYVIKPLFFNGGDIGKLAVCGTVNDLAMSGAKPLYISCSLIIEEGFAIKDLQRIVQSMRASADEAGVKIVTGDSKVVEHGKGDGLYINTAGVGVIETESSILPNNIRTGDAIIVNSDLGRHGIAIMLQREGMDFASAIDSDCASLAAPVQALFDANIDVHCLRDLTRGGLSSCLIELAAVCGRQFEIREQGLPVRQDVRSACELLGFDPLYIANEGCFVLFVPQSQAGAAIATLQKHSNSQQAVQIGTVSEEHADGRVILQTAMGISRILELLSGEQLPRIC